MTTIYLAASFRRIDEARLCAEDLYRQGHEITSRWLNGSHQAHGAAAANAVEGAVEQIPLDEGRLFATDDVEDIKRADVLIGFSEPPYSTRSRGGHHVELGMALALGKRVILVGPRENAFHCLPQVEQYASWKEFLAATPLREPGS